MKAQCKASVSTMQGTIDDAKTQTTKTMLAHEDSVETLMNKVHDENECDVDTSTQNRGGIDKT